MQKGGTYFDFHLHFTATASLASLIYLLCVVVHCRHSGALSTGIPYTPAPSVHRQMMPIGDSDKTHWQEVQRGRKECMRLRWAGPSDKPSTFPVMPEECSTLPPKRVQSRPTAGTRQTGGSCTSGHQWHSYTRNSYCIGF